jgi:hypothetical protein
LDEVITEVGSVGDYAFAMHPGAAGDVTFVPLTALDRESALRFEGFFLAGLLDVEREEVR